MNPPRITRLIPCAHNAMTMEDNSKGAVSIAMCTYNGERFLREQLESIAKQTLVPSELVVCDDGSIDHTPEIVDDFARAASFPVRFVRNSQNLGPTRNFEKAIGLCSGDFIALSDQDDIWSQHKLARQSELLARDPELGGVFSDARIIDDRSGETGQRLWAQYFFTSRKQRIFRAGRAAAVMIQGNVVTGATLMFRAKLRRFFSPIPPSSFHDDWIAWMIIVYSKLGLIEEPLIQYRVHRDQQVGLINLAPDRSLPLRKRLAKARDEEGALHLAHARYVKAEMDVLEKRVLEANDLKAQAILPVLRNKVEFFSGRGTPHKNSLQRLRFILRNADRYRQYERTGAWNCFLRDLVLLFF